jgi:hypothetical protein
MAIFDIIVHSVSIYHLNVTANIDTENKHKLFNLIITNILNQVSVYFRYFFIGLRLPCYTLFDQDFETCPGGDDHKGHSHSIHEFDYNLNELNDEQLEIYNFALEKYGGEVAPSAVRRPSVVRRRSS